VGYVVNNESKWCRLTFVFRRLLHNESGSAAVMVAVSLVAILGMMGLAIDVGQLRLAKQGLQMAADAAALSAALQLTDCGNTANCSSLKTAAQSALTENSFTGSTLLTNCAASSTTALTLTVNNGPCALGTANPHNGNTNYVEVVVSQPQPTYFAGILGISSVLIKTRAEAARTGGTNCMFALDPTGSGAISVDLLAAVSAPCGIVDESNSSSALQCAWFAAINASQIAVVGGVSTFLCSVNPTPKTHITMPNPSDPLAYLPKPAVPSCGTSHSVGASHHGSDAALTITTTTILYADNAYCGGITIGPGANVTFDTTYGSTFVLTSKNGGTNTLPGGLQVDFGATLTGNGVTFYNYGPSGGIKFDWASFTLGGVNLTAPTTGTYNGILFFQDPGNSSAAQIVGSAAWNVKLQGTYYFPAATVNFTFDGPVQYNILDAKDIHFMFLTLANGYTHGSSAFSNDYSSLANGSPAHGSGAVLEQ
jgi:Flp pilus assembly protein TadG